MDVNAWHVLLSWVMILSGTAALIALLFTTAPYGRYSRGGWGVQINAKLAWMLQELPSLLIPLYLLCIFKRGAGAAAVIEAPTSPRSAFTIAFLLHYTYRALLFPLLLRGGKPTPLAVFVLSTAFCIWNGFLQGWMLVHQMAPDLRWRLRSGVGLVMWLFGWLSNMHADHVLRNLRGPNETGYKIPYGGLFGLVSAANYSGEIIEWSGYALGTWSWASCAFAWFTFCNLAPRGHHHHQWYKQKFEQYPPKRRAVLPFLW